MDELNADELALSCIQAQSSSSTEVSHEVIAPSSSKSQKRVDRQQRRRERRAKKAEALKSKTPEHDDPKTLSGSSEEAQPVRRKKSLPGFLGKHRHDIQTWLKHYMFIRTRADDAGVQCLRDMDDAKRAKFEQEYIDIAEFLDKLAEYLEEERMKATSPSECK